jgi:hypothetical protein
LRISSPFDCAGQVCPAAAARRAALSQAEVHLRSAFSSGGDQCASEQQGGGDSADFIIFISSLDHRFNNSGSLAMLTAMRQASSCVSKFSVLGDRGHNTLQRGYLRLSSSLLMRFGLRKT